MELRECQMITVEDVRDSIRRGNRSVIIQAPCGTGKTIIAAYIIQQALAKGKRVIFLVHFRQLAYQAVARFKEFGMGDTVGMIMAGEPEHLDRPIQIISVQTYGRRLALADLTINRWFKQADLIVYDEAHSSVAKTRKAILDLYKDTSIIIGLTATPCRADGRPLGGVYEDIISCSSIRALTKDGYLVPMRYYSAEHLPDLTNISTVAGDYNKKELGKRVDKAKLVGDILENWLRIAGDRQTLIFATNVKHSRNIKKQFIEAGIACEHIDAHTPDDERQEALEQLRVGDLQVITNVGVYSEGADLPWVSCIIVAKPTKSLARWIQMAGRGLRPWEGKEYCILIDHTGNVYDHGFLDEEVEWTLSGKEKAWKKVKKEVKEKVVMTCAECQNLFYGHTCPQCGLKVKDYSKKITTAEAELHELTKSKVKKKKKSKKEFTIEEKQRFYGQLLYHRITKGYREGWIYNQYKTKFKVVPTNMSEVTPIEPDQKFKNYLTYLNIRYYKGRGRK